MPELAPDRIDSFFVLHSARADGWRRVATEAGQWAAGRSSRAKVKELMAELAIIEEFHASPGHAVMRLLQQRIEADDASAAAALARRISEAVVLNKDSATNLEVGGDKDEAWTDLLPDAFGRGDRKRPSFEALFVTNQPESRWPTLCDEVRRLRRPEDEFVYESVFVSSFEDAFCAAIVNPRIAAVVTIDDMPYRSRHDAPVLRSMIDPIAEL